MNIKDDLLGETENESFYLRLLNLGELYWQPSEEIDPFSVEIFLNKGEDPVAGSFVFEERKVLFRLEGASPYRHVYYVEPSYDFIYKDPDSPSFMDSFNKEFTKTGASCLVSENFIEQISVTSTNKSKQTPPKHTPKKTAKTKTKR